MPKLNLCLTELLASNNSSYISRITLSFISNTIISRKFMENHFVMTVKWKFFIRLIESGY